MQSSLQACAFEECGTQVEVREWCKRHYGVLYRRGVLPEREPKLSYINVDKRTAECPKHGHVKLRIRTRKSGTEYYACRACERGDHKEDPVKARQRAYRWRAANPEKRKAQLRRNRVKKAKEVHGWVDDFEQADYEALLLRQNGACAICDTRPSSAKHLAIDHDHVTGKIRGLLCTGCNWALGRFKDDPARFDAAARYLREPTATSK